MKVTLVLDAACGDRLSSLHRPTWVCDSPLNRPVAERIWATASDGPDALTVFHRDPESDEHTLADLLPTIDDHHPGWTALSIVGVPLTPAVRACFERYEPGRFVESRNEFTFARSPLR